METETEKENIGQSVTTVKNVTPQSQGCKRAAYTPFSSQSKSTYCPTTPQRPLVTFNNATPSSITKAVEVTVKLHEEFPLDAETRMVDDRVEGVDMIGEMNEDVDMICEANEDVNMIGAELHEGSPTIGELHEYSNMIDDELQEDNLMIGQTHEDVKVIKAEVEEESNMIGVAVAVQEESNIIGEVEEETNTIVAEVQVSSICGNEALTSPSSTDQSNVDPTVDNESASDKGVIGDVEEGVNIIGAEVQESSIHDNEAVTSPYSTGQSNVDPTVDSELASDIKEKHSRTFKEMVRDRQFSLEESPALSSITLEEGHTPIHRGFKRAATSPLTGQLRRSYCPTTPSVSMATPHSAQCFPTASPSVSSSPFPSLSTNPVEVPVETDIEGELTIGTRQESDELVCSEVQKTLCFSNEDKDCSFSVDQSNVDTVAKDDNQLTKENEDEDDCETNDKTQTSIDTPQKGRYTLTFAPIACEENHEDVAVATEEDKITNGIEIQSQSPASLSTNEENHKQENDVANYKAEEVVATAINDDERMASFIGFSNDPAILSETESSMHDISEDNLHDVRKNFTKEEKKQPSSTHCSVSEDNFHNVRNNFMEKEKKQPASADSSCFSSMHNISDDNLHDVMKSFTEQEKKRPASTDCSFLAPISCAIDAASMNAFASSVMKGEHSGKKRKQNKKMRRSMFEFDPLACNDSNNENNTVDSLSLPLPSVDDTESMEAYPTIGSDMKQSNDMIGMDSRFATTPTRTPKRSTRSHTPSSSRYPSFMSPLIPVPPSMSTGTTSPTPLSNNRIQDLLMQDFMPPTPRSQIKYNERDLDKFRTEKDDVIVQKDQQIKELQLVITQMEETAREKEEMRLVDLRSANEKTEMMISEIKQLAQNNQEKLIAEVNQKQEELIVEANQKQEELIVEANQKQEELIAEANQKQEELIADIAKKNQREEELITKANQKEEELIAKANQREEELVAQANQREEELIAKANEKEQELISQLNKAIEQTEMVRAEGKEREIEREKLWTEEVRKVEARMGLEVDNIKKELADKIQGALEKERAMNAVIAEREVAYAGVLAQLAAKEKEAEQRKCEAELLQQESEQLSQENRASKEHSVKMTAVLNEYQKSIETMVVEAEQERLAHATKYKAMENERNEAIKEAKQWESRHEDLYDNYKTVRNSNKDLQETADKLTKSNEELQAALEESKEKANTIYNKAQEKLNEANQHIAMQNELKAREIEVLQEKNNRELTVFKGRLQRSEATQVDMERENANLKEQTAKWKKMYDELLGC